MYKCTNCGNEFDGKFCPECGTKRVEELFCPDCGAKALPNARFCAECGHAFYSSAAGTVAENASRPTAAARADSDSPLVSAADSVLPSAQTAENKTAKKAGGEPPAVLAKVYKALRYTPAAMFALFSLLLLLFYIAPIAKTSEFMGMGGKSSGSVYSMADGLVGISVTLLLFAAAAIAYSAACAVFTLRADKRDREVKLFGKLDMTLGEAVSAFSVIAYLIFVILAGVAIGKSSCSASSI